jgi:hypothetical protein
MIAQLSDAQLRAFLDFGLGKAEGEKSPFPWQGERWARRVDQYDNFRLNIFRDQYERKRIPRPRRSVVRMEDYPDIEESMEGFSRVGM